MNRGILKAVTLCAVMGLIAPTAYGGLIGHWTFDEGSGTTAVDSSGSGYNGTLAGDVSYVAGQVGTGALQFAGTNNSRVEVGHYAPLDLAGTDYTVAFWAKGGGGNRMVNYDNGNNGNGGWGMQANYSGYVTWTHNPGGTNLPGANVLDATNWHHLAFVYDGTHQTFYRDGVQYLQTDCSTDIASRGTDVLWFGSIPTYGQNYVGALDDIRIYNNALSATEVAGLMNTPEPGTLVLLATGLIGLLAYAWRRRK